MLRRRLIFSAPAQPATAHPVRCKWRDNRDQGKAQHSGREKVAPAARMADQFSRKSFPRPWPRELRPANTTVPTSTSGSSAVCQRVAALSFMAVV